MFCLVNSGIAQEVKINHNGTNGFVIETDGTIRADGAATTWDDLKVPFTTSMKGSNSLPDFDYTNIGLLFPNDAAEAIYMVVQMPHAYKEGSDIYPHVHWQQSNATFPTWNIQYKWFNSGESVPPSFTPVTTNTGVFNPYTSGNLAQISSFAAITGSGKKISSILLIKFWRTGGPAGDILAFEFDIHYEIDTQGSREEFHKENQ